jgi:hypothetical protein
MCKRLWTSEGCYRARRGYCYWAVSELPVSVSLEPELK